MRKDTNLNIYERKILQTLDTMKWIYLAIVLLNLALPVVAPTVVGIRLFLQWVVILIHGWGLLNGLSYFSQSVPAVPVLGVRLVQVGWYLYFKDINWIPFSILLVLDILFILYLYNHKSKYEYIRVKNSELDEEEL